MAGCTQPDNPIQVAGVNAAHTTTEVPLRGTATVAAPVLPASGSSQAPRPTPLTRRPAARSTPATPARPLRVRPAQTTQPTTLRGFALTPPRRPARRGAPPLGIAWGTEEGGQDTPERRRLSRRPVQALARRAGGLVLPPVVVAGGEAGGWVGDRAIPSTSACASRAMSSASGTAAPDQPALSLSRYLVEAGLGRTPRRPGRNGGSASTRSSTCASSASTSTICPAE